MAIKKSGGQTLTTKEQRLAKAFKEIEKKYDINEREYRALYKMQGGRCAICQVARGDTRMLGVDHDHTCKAIHRDGAVAGACCVRGLLCSGSLSLITCNRLIGPRGSLAKLKRAVRYLETRPARTFLLALRAGGQPCGTCGWIGMHREKCPHDQGNILSWTEEGAVLRPGCDPGAGWKGVRSL